MMDSTQRSDCHCHPDLGAAEPCVAHNDGTQLCRCWIRPERTILSHGEKLEPLNKKESYCSPKVCAIFGKHDEDPYEKPCELNPKRHKNENSSSLGDPIGLVASTIDSKMNGGKYNVGQVRFATYLVAFARFHINPETTWTSTIIDEVLKRGLMLYSESQNQPNELRLSRKTNVSRSITSVRSSRKTYAPQEKNVSREFELMGCKFHIELLSRPLSPDRPGEGGDGQGSDFLLLENVNALLKDTMRKHTYYLLCIEKFYIMLWLSKGVYFVFDVCGRKLDDFKSNDKDCVAVLMCLRTLDNVNHLILNLSGLSKNSPCTLRELKIVKLITPSGNIIQRDYGRRQREYKIINDDYAYVKGNLHLSLNPAALLRNRSALAAGVTALLVSKIDHPATWNSKVIDKIICFGFNFCQAHWLKCGSSDPIDVGEFPTRLNIGQFHAQIELFPKKYTGFWYCVPDFISTELAQTIKRAFEEGYNKLLLQINYQVYAIWKQKGFIFLFDPFRHRIAGLSDQPNSTEKYSTVKMFRSFDVFMLVLNSILLDSNRSSHFSLHAMKVRHIQLKNKADGTPALFQQSAFGSDGEVISLNEAVCFEEAEDICQKMLGEISDYEEEESELEELELKTSSSVLEAMEEEEGKEKDVFEDMEGVESSSEDEGKRKKKGKKGKKGGEGKGAKGKGGKGGSGKGSKKKGAARDGDDKVGRGSKDDKAGRGSKDDKAGRDSKDDKYKRVDQYSEDRGGEGDIRGKKLGKAIGDEQSDSEKERLAELERQRLLEIEKQRIREMELQKQSREELEKQRQSQLERQRKSESGKPRPSELERQRQADLEKKKGDEDKSKEKEDEDKRKKDADKAARCQRLREERMKASKVDDECEDFFKNVMRFCSAPNPNRYPGCTSKPADMAVVGSESGSYDSLCKLVCAGFRKADRIFIMTPWGNFVLFRCVTDELKNYFLYDGCTCSINRFRHLDLSVGTAGLLCFKEINDMIEYMRLATGVFLQTVFHLSVITFKKIVALNKWLNFPKNLWEMKSSETLNEQESSCSSKHCAIFRKQDEDRYLDVPCELKREKKKGYSNSSLGEPIGLVTSAVYFETDGVGSDIAEARYATYLVAVARFHLNPITTWDTTVVDEVLKHGLMLYVNSLKEDNQPASPQELYAPHEHHILREFELMGYGFQIEVRNSFVKKSTFTDTTNHNESGDGNATGLLVLKNIKNVLKSTLRGSTYYLINANEFYFMIWLCKGGYLIFDVCGRKVDNFHSDDKEGVAMLMCLKTLDNVNHLILNLSGLREEDTFLIRELKIVKIVTPIGYIMQQEYDVINEDYACIRGSLHLSLNPNEVLRNRSALSAGVIALVVAKINHPATWNTKVVDKIISFGVKICHAFYLHSPACCNVEEFPIYFNIGQFRVHVELFISKYAGFWRCVPNYKSEDLVQAVKEAFEEGHLKLLLQINYQVYAIWKQKGFIYLFDPFRHRIMGLTNQTNNVENVAKHATVRMFRSFDIFMIVLNSILQSSNRSSPFFLHAMKVHHIQLKDNGDGTLAAFEEPALSSDGEIQSLNEVICFEEAEDMCQKMLREISDFEDEDLYSDVNELELKTSSSELEIIEEEIEEKAMFEDMEGLESSSGSEGEREKADSVDSKRAKHTFKDMKKWHDENLRKVKAIEAVESKQVYGQESLRERVPLKLSSNHELEKFKLAGSETKKGTRNASWLQRLKDPRLKHKIAAVSAIVQRTQLFQNIQCFSSAPNPNRSPGFTDNPAKMEVVCSKSGKYNSLYRGIFAGFRKADRLLILTPWGNFILFSHITNDIRNYFLFDGCTCNVNRFRHLDLSMGTAGLLFFQGISDMVHYIRKCNKDNASRKHKTVELKTENIRADDESFQSTPCFCSIPDPNRYPGFTSVPADMVVICSKSAEHRSLYKGIYDGFQKTDRMLVLTPCGKFIIFCRITNKNIKSYFLYEGCTCNINRFRHWNLNMGTAGLLFFQDISDIVKYIRDKHRKKKCRDKALRCRELKDQEVNYGTEVIPGNTGSSQNMECSCSVPRPNRYQSFAGNPVDTDVVFSESGNRSSLCKRIRDGFEKTNRMLVVTPCGKFSVFCYTAHNIKTYFLYDACTCNIDHCHDWDFTRDMTGMLYFQEISDMVNYMCIDAKTRHRAYHS
uniref:Uncharacterized protein n=1 Tax=Glossina austeni TaxID=7395 RepID=A0A1A9UN74_GLOAU